MLQQLRSRLGAISVPSIVVLKFSTEGGRDAIINKS